MWTDLRTQRSQWQYYNNNLLFNNCIHVYSKCYVNLFIRVAFLFLKDNNCFYVILVWNAESHQFEEKCIISAEIAIKKGSSAWNGKSALGQAKKIWGLPCPYFIPAASSIRNRLGKSKNYPIHHFSKSLWASAHSLIIGSLNSC